MAPWCSPSYEQKDTVETGCERVWKPQHFKDVKDTNHFKHIRILLEILSILE